MLHRIGGIRGPLRGTWPVHVVRPVAQQRLFVAPMRVQTYAGMPTPEQVSNTFAEPVRNFIIALSRIARIIVFTTAGVATIAFVGWEGTHMYVEHVAMPREQIGSGVFDDVKKQLDDPWGWLHDFGEETWVGLNGRGTDSRLGFLGRHQLRAAWMSLTWGGGVSVDQFLSAGGIGSPRGAAGANRPKAIAAEGTSDAEVYLSDTLATAEKAGIRLPDMAALRAGLQTPASRGRPNQSIDRTAVMLEYRLAWIRERIGTKQALKGALAGYTRMYDALASVDNTNRAFSSNNRASGLPSISADRLVRLSTRIGELQNLLGNAPEAEQWLLHAVSIAGGPSLEEGRIVESGREGLLRHDTSAGGAGIDRTRSPVEVDAAAGALKAVNIALPQVEAPASPSLTRSLVQSLLALSAFYAKPTDRVALEKALQLQASALRLTRVESSRLALSSATDNDALGAQLHKLWLAHHDGLACVHVGETMYGLRTLKGDGLGSLGTLLAAVGLSGEKEKQGSEETIAWLDEARSRSDLVLGQLANVKSRRPNEPLELLAKWKEAPVNIQTYAKRLVRDASRLRDAVDDMKTILASA